MGGCYLYWDFFSYNSGSFSYLEIKLSGSEGRGKSHFLYYTAFCKLQCNHKQKGWLNHLVHSAHGWRDTAPRGGLFPSHVQTSKVVCNPFCITGTFKDKVSCLKAGSLVEKCTFLCWEAVCVFLLRTAFSQLAGVAYKDLVPGGVCHTCTTHSRY